MIEKILNELLLDENRLLSFEEEQTIFRSLNENPQVREDVQTIMIKSNMRLIYNIIKDYYPVVTISKDDMIQLGMIGISKAVDKFDYKKEFRFASYATYWIKQSISRGLHNALRETEQSMNISELKKKYYQTEMNLTSTFKRRVTFNEVASKMGIKPSELMVIFNSVDLESLDKSLNNSQPIIDKLKNEELTPQELLLNDERKKMILMAIDLLSPIEQEIIKYRYGYIDGIYHSFSEIADRFGFSRQRAQVIEKNALLKMREFLEEIQ